MGSEGTKSMASLDNRAFGPLRSYEIDA